MVSIEYGAPSNLENLMTMEERRRLWRKQERELEKIELPLAGATGFEPATDGFGDRHSTS